MTMRKKVLLALAGATLVFPAVAQAQTQVQAGAPGSPAPTAAPVMPGQEASQVQANPFMAAQGGQPQGQPGMPQGYAQQGYPQQGYGQPGMAVANGVLAQANSPAWPPLPAGAAKNGGVPSPEDLAFQMSAQHMFPMSPDQIRAFRDMLSQQREATDPPLGNLKEVTRSIDLTLKPGEKVPTIRLAGSHVSTVTFSDITGREWPVLTVTSGNPSLFTAQPAGKPGETNIVVVSPLMRTGQSNLVVTLVGHPVPIVLTLKSGEQEIDSRLDVRLESRGPNASFDIVNQSALPPTNDSRMQDFLDGVPPQGAKSIPTSSREVEAWRLEDMVYIRTKMDVLSPAYIGKSSNISGFNVFSMAESPVIIVSKDGRMTAVSLQN
jgi:intracellular multiplication protein IcmK